MQGASVIVDAVRSPIGVKKGRMVGMNIAHVAAQVLRALMERNQPLQPAQVEDVVLGCAFPEAVQGMLMAKAVALLAGFPQEVTGKVVNRFCGSSMDAVHQLSQAIEAGDLDIGIAIGVEDMFAVPMGGYNPVFDRELVKLGYYMNMGETAENLAKELNITREDQEAFAVASHEKALAAWEAGRFDNEVIPVSDDTRKIERDEGPRQPDLEKMRSLKPAFLENGTITAATSSPISMGVAAALVMREETAKKLGLKPRVRIKARAIAGVPPTVMGKGPLPATEKALKRAGMQMSDIDVIELNEAFAAQSLYVIRKGEWPMEKINLNGGAIALGHPLGCSGVRILGTLINVMEQQNAATGLATMCIGTGQGIATIVERV